MTCFICTKCGTQFADGGAPPAVCTICDDPRERSSARQGWTTLAELSDDHENQIRVEGELVGIGTSPAVAIGQRALLVPHGESNLLWDCITLIDDDTVAEIEGRGGLSAIAISHPHFHSGMVEWARRFDCPIYLHAANAEWVMRTDPAVHLWDGETLDLGDGLTLIRTGGHFPGSTVLHYDVGDGALLTSDTIHVVQDRTHVAFMLSFPNLIPLPADAVEAIGRAIAPFAYDAIYGGWWDFVIPTGAQAAVQRSVSRYGAVLRGEPFARRAVP